MVWLGIAPFVQTLKCDFVQSQFDAFGLHTVSFTGHTGDIP